MLPVRRGADDLDAIVAGEERLDGLDEEGSSSAMSTRTGRICGRGAASMIEGLTPRGQSYSFAVPGSPREQIQKLLVTGDNRLKQGVSPEKARASYEQALQLAREAGLEENVRPLVEVRLADLERLFPGSTRSSPPDA